MLGVLHLDAHTYWCLAVLFKCSHPSTSAVGALCVENNCYFNLPSTLPLLAHHFSLRFHIVIFFRFIVICCVLESQENEITKPGLTMLTKTLARSNSGHFLEPVRHFDFLIRTFPVLWQTSNKKWCYLASVSDFRDFRSNKTWAQQQIKQVVFSLSLGGGCPSGEADAKTSGSQGLKQSENSI